MSYQIIKGFAFVFVLTSYHSSGFLLDTTPTSACFDQLQNCDIVNASFGACKDPHNAYQLCRKFCGLCSVVHGGWSVWSAWSVCDATCGNGTMTRRRQCNNPSPYNGGEDCQGPSQNIGECLLSRCPTHGGWGAWSEWGTCSKTCGVGLRRRDRVCDNPWPSRDGNHCFGDNINYEICTESSCSVWSAWGSWSACSNTCGYGLMERTRTCTGPPDQMFCVGSDVDKDSCRTSCNEYRYWTSWGSWGSCADTCGIRKRTRVCSGSTDLVNQCIGSDHEDGLCPTNSHNCTSAFTIYGLVPDTTGVFKFTTFKFNDGSDYNPSTGTFTCRVPGLYYFAYSLTKLKESYRTMSWVSARLQLNGSSMAYAITDPTDDATDLGSYMIGSSATVHLNRGDTITMTGSTATSFESSFSTFTGHLIAPDTA